MHTHARAQTYTTHLVIQLYVVGAQAIGGTVVDAVIFMQDSHPCHCTALDGLADL